MLRLADVSSHRFAGPSTLYILGNISPFSYKIPSHDTFFSINTSLIIDRKVGDPSVGASELLVA